MTKEEIQRILDLSLEYYKSEVFGTDKESEKPSRERIDWIYDKMTGSSEIPKDLEKAARKSAIAPFNLDIDEEHLYKYPYLPIAEQKFIEGAKWQAEQMMKEAVEVRVQTSPLNGPLGISVYCCNFPSKHPFYHCKDGDKVYVIIVKKENEQSR